MSKRSKGSYGIKKRKSYPSVMTLARVASIGRRWKEYAASKVPPVVRRGGYGLGIETKFIDQIKVDTTFFDTWNGGELDPAAANCIGACTQGTGESNRDGNKILVKSIIVQGFVHRIRGPDQADVRETDICQIALVMDTQTNGAQLNAEDVYVSGVEPELPARRVLANATRFKILKTKVLTLHDVCAMTDGASTASIAGNLVPFRWFVPMNQVVTFGGNAGTIADIKDVSFHLIGCTTGGAAAADKITYNTRVRFVG